MNQNGKHKNYGTFDRGRRCTLCKRIVNRVVRHHVKPKKFGYDFENGNNKMYQCRDCEKMVHAMFKLKELRDTYNSPQKLLASGRMKNYIAWVKNKPEGIVKHPKRMWKGGKYE